MRHKRSWPSSAQTHWSRSPRATGRRGAAGATAGVGSDDDDGGAGSGVRASAARSGHGDAADGSLGVDDSTAEATGAATSGVAS